MCPYDKIAVASSRDQIEACRRFWFEIYCEELGRPYAVSALRDSRSSRLLSFPYDSFGTVLFAEEAARVIGTVICIPGPLACNTMEATWHEMDCVGQDYPGRISITTKLAVAPSFRGSSLSVRLAMAAYEFYVERAVRYNFIGVHPNLASMYESLGFKPHFPAREIPGHGPLASMMLDLTNHEHLRAVSSPFLTILEELESSGRFLGSRSDSNGHD